MGLLFYHGIEISELLRLETSDYNPKTSVLTIRRKREKEWQVYIFNQALRKQMEQWISVHEYFENGGLYHNRMFLSKLGRPLSMKMVTNIFDKYRVLAGIEREATPKDLKRSMKRYAKELVMEWCG
jgi:site-specific recombinase XerD